MNKILTALVLSLLLFVSSGLAGGVATRSNEFVECTVSTRPSTLKPGATGMLFITLKPKKGIHVNLTPPLSVIIDSSDVVAASAKREIPKAKKYLNTAKPIRYTFTLSPTARTGEATIKGTLTYFYCSDAEGWCSKFTLPIAQKITVVK